MKIALVHKNSAISYKFIAVRGTKCYFCKGKLLTIYEEEKSKGSADESCDRGAGACKRMGKD